ncbi:hypothetical protein AB6A40_005611 [Gnathostoma spinigerum]|uniref:Ras-related protein Rab-33 n=1 Tax=Gnathostoma spinigerum TaxID=75299 RepID=A0ABD6EQE1_9BILA
MNVPIHGISSAIVSTSESTSPVNPVVTTTPQPAMATAPSSHSGPSPAKVPQTVASMASQLPPTSMIAPPVQLKSQKYASLSPPAPLPDLNFPSSGGGETAKQSPPIKHVPYPTISPSVSHKTALKPSYSNPPGKPYKSKRVFKVIIIGDAGVGKTCLSFRFCNGRFPAQTEATIGVDFRERSVLIDGELIRVQLWDTAGQERYRQSIVAHYYRNVNAVVFVYDVSNIRSFYSLSQWITECRSHSAASSTDIPRILIGNKCDLITEDRVKTDMAQMFADQNDMALFETSALSDSEADHVESIFMTLVHKLQQSKPMHVQSDEERKREGERLLLKAEEVARRENEGWCC